LVVSQILGRPLEPNEYVKYVDGDRWNWSLDNLRLRSGEHEKPSAELFALRAEAAHAPIPRVLVETYQAGEDWAELTFWPQRFDEPAYYRFAEIAREAGLRPLPVDLRWYCASHLHARAVIAALRHAGFYIDVRSVWVT
jgi:hypothetical protein